MSDKKPADALRVLTDAKNYWEVNWRLVQHFNNLDEAVILAYIVSQQSYWAEKGKLEFCTFPFIDPESTIMVLAKNNQHKEGIRKIKLKTDQTISGHFYFCTVNTMKEKTTLNSRRQKTAIDNLNILYRKLGCDEFLDKHPALILVGYKGTPPKRYISVDEVALDFFLSTICQ